MNKILTVEDLSVNYGSLEVLKNISFDVQEGDYIGVVGPNGGGKTTLMKAIIGLVPSKQGIISFPGNGKTNDFFGYLPQKMLMGSSIFPATVKEIISMGTLNNKKFPKFVKQNDYRKMEIVLKKLKIEDLQKKRIGDLSGGQLQRVLLARALVASPQILILDEPTSALDPSIREEFYEIIGLLNKEEGVTILLVSHDISSVGKYTKKMLYLDSRLVFYGTYDEFCESKEMTDYFGAIAQHHYCWRHG